MSKTVAAEALRTCLYENGIDVLTSFEKLCAFAPAELYNDEHFRAVYESGAVYDIREAVMDAAHYADSFARAMEKLRHSPAAEEALMLFYNALGFPSAANTANEQTVYSGDWQYTGEVKGGRPHGRGREALIIDGTQYSSSDGQWFCGEPFGYFHSIDTLGVESYSFCIGGFAIGKETRIWSPDDIEVIDHGYDPEKVGKGR